MIFVETALKTHIVLFNLGCEGFVAGILHSVSLLAVVTPYVLVLQVSDETVKLLLKHNDGFNRILSKVLSEFWF